MVSKLRISLSNCIVCQASTTKFPLLCETCFTELPLFDYDKLTGDLLNWPKVSSSVIHNHFDHLIVISSYKSPFNQWIPQYKYGGHFHLSSLFSDLLAQLWLDLVENNNLSRPDAAVAIPLHMSKWQQRGFNQSTLMARKFAKKIDVKYEDNFIFRSKATRPQVGMTGTARRKNLKNAFTVQFNSNVPKHIILIDDVVTTGTTVNEVSRLLKAAGVQTITVMAISLSVSELNESALPQ